MNGESLRMTRRLPGHRWATITTRYTHPDDATASEAAERVAEDIEWKFSRGAKLQ